MDEGRKRRLGASARWRLAALALIGVGAVSVLALAGRPPAATIGAADSVAVIDPEDVYDPSRAGEALPEGYTPMLGRDRIHPVYDPSFAPAGEVDWPDNTDVIGVVGVTEAKAYPVSHLNFREMVIDDIEGIPILVSW